MSTSQNYWAQVYKKTMARWPTVAAVCVSYVIITHDWFPLPQTVPYPYLQLANNNKINLETTPDGWLPNTAHQQCFKKGRSLVMKNTPGQDSAEKGNYVVCNPTSNNYDVQLPDGTNILLNAASSVKFPVSFGPQNRSVETTGEAYFKVVKNTGAPFTVTIANGIKIVALGTSFNVSAYTGEPEKITLLEGAVKLATNKGSRLLKPGYQVVVDDKQNIQQAVLNNPRQTIAWTNDMFDFRNRDIRSAMLELARHYQVKVIFEGSFSNAPSSGMFSRKQPLSEILEILEKHNKIKIKQEKGQWYVYGEQ